MIPVSYSSIEQTTAKIIKQILFTHPNAQAIYLYGTWGSEYQRQDSDADIAVLLPFDETKQVDFQEWHLLATEVATTIYIEHVDLVNLRCVDTTFQAEILRTGREIFCADKDERLKFETIVLSMYQKLNEERAEIYKEIIKSRRVLAL